MLVAALALFVVLILVVFVAQWFGWVKKEDVPTPPLPEEIDPDDMDVGTG